MLSIPKAVPSKLQVPLPALSPSDVDVKPQRRNRLMAGPGFDRVSWLKAI